MQGVEKGGLPLSFRSLCQAAGPWTLALLLLVPAIAQDVVRLKNGSSLEGRITEETADGILLSFPGGSVSLGRGQIQEITYGEPVDEAERDEALGALTRFEDRDSWFLLYRDGKRVGYRTRRVRREIRDGLPGYRLEDRLVFLPAPGGAPELDVVTEEFVDPDLRPVGFRHSETGPDGTHVVSGRREGHLLRILEGAGSLGERSATILRDETGLAGFNVLAAGREDGPGQGLPRRVFDAREGRFRDVLLMRRSESVNWDGRTFDASIIIRRMGDRVLETWTLPDGGVMREEIGTPGLVALSCGQEIVEGYARGEGPAGKDDLGLEYRSPDGGFSALRPDFAWEVSPSSGGGAALVSFLRPGLRATVDVFRLASLPEDVTEEGLCLDVLARMGDAAGDLLPEGPTPGRLGNRGALLFHATGVLGGTQVRTLGALALEGRQAFLILCAAPAERFAEAESGFQELLGTVRIAAGSRRTPVAGPTP